LRRRAPRATGSSGPRRTPRPKREFPRRRSATVRAPAAAPVESLDCRIRAFRTRKPPPARRLRRRIAARDPPNTRWGGTVREREFLGRSFDQPRLLRGDAGIRRTFVVILIDTASKQPERKEIAEAHRHRHDMSDRVAQVQR